MRLWSESVDEVRLSGTGGFIGGRQALHSWGSALARVCRGTVLRAVASHDRLIGCGIRSRRSAAARTGRHGIPEIVGQGRRFCFQVWVNDSGALGLGGGVRLLAQWILASSLPLAGSSRCAAGLVPRCTKADRARHCSRRSKMMVDLDVIRPVNRQQFLRGGLSTRTLEATLSGGTS